MPDSTATVDPVGAKEIAARLGVPRATVDQWRQRGVLPDPAWTVGGRPCWEWQAIHLWAQQTGRAPKVTEVGEKVTDE